MSVNKLTVYKCDCDDCEKTQTYNDCSIGRRPRLITLKIPSQCGTLCNDEVKDFCSLICLEKWVKLKSIKRQTQDKAIACFALKNELEILQRP